MKTAQLRQLFLDYFQTKQHTLVPSSSLIPLNDPTLLFTNAGMVPFKDVFLGNEKLAYTRACSAQRCVRAGGKHNDLENVGYTARHHTFFEMMGNFSFGDYFKREAIYYAWEFVTQQLKLAPEKLWITIHHSDEESAKIWLNEIKIKANRFSRCGDQDNYWSMGDTGPCGPCTEIFYDHGADVAGGPPGTPEQEGDRYVEIWNIVFMQNDRHADGSVRPLPKPSVDTGMGLERVAAVLQGVHSNYDTDLFQTLIKAVHQLLKEDEIEVTMNQAIQTSMNVVVDHLRSTSFLIADGVLPGNEGRAYVLRRILRRAVRHGQKIGFQRAFLYRLFPALLEEMGKAYPYLHEKKSFIVSTLQEEEQQFEKTLTQGLSLLDEALKTLKHKRLPGHLIFKLYDTYGFPADLTADIARERGIELDQEGFTRCMQAQRERSKQASQFEVAYQSFAALELDNDFVGYNSLRVEATVMALMQNGDLVEQVTAPAELQIVLDKTPFYAESGGQVGDQGELNGQHTQARVIDTIKEGQLHVHRIQLLSGTLSRQDKLAAQVNPVTREATRLNHSATHLLHAILRTVLGEQVQQKGSLVTAEKLRFDFSHKNPLSLPELHRIEALVNDQIRANHGVTTEIMSKEQALSSGAMALFNEKYAEQLRVLSMGEVSCEICGGTHVRNTGDIGLFKIISESSIASGVRRIEACTGAVAIRLMQQHNETLLQAAQQLQSDPSQLLDKLQQVQQQVRELSKQAEQHKAQAATYKAAELVAQADTVHDLKLLVTACPEMNKAALRPLLDDLKQRLKTAVIVLVLEDADCFHLVAGVTKDATDRINAVDLIRMLAEQLGGKGGGRPDMAQAGGAKTKTLPALLASVKPWVSKRLES